MLLQPPFRFFHFRIFWLYANFSLLSSQGRLILKKDKIFVKLQNPHIKLRQKEVDKKIIYIH